MVHAQEDGDTLSEDELFSMVLILYFAGHVTTVNLIGNGVVALLTHPGELARFKADPTLARGVVEETLRYWGPVDWRASRARSPSRRCSDAFRICASRRRARSSPGTAPPACVGSVRCQSRSESPVV